MTTYNILNVHSGSVLKVGKRGRQKSKINGFRRVHIGYKLPREKAPMSYFAQGPKISKVGPVPTEKVLKMLTYSILNVYRKT